jgi:hypothetical protein
MIANFTLSNVSSAHVAVPAFVQATASLHKIRDDFRALHAHLDSANRLLPSVGSKWNLGAVLTHVVMSLESTCPMFLDSALAGKPKAFPALFETRFGDWISFKLSQHRATKLSLDQILTAYDAAQDKFIARLATLSEAQWQCATRLPAPNARVYSISDFVAVEMPEHFAIHQKEILDTLARAR